MEALREEFDSEIIVRRGDAGEYPGVIPDPAEGEPLPMRGNFLAESTLIEAGLRPLRKIVIPHNIVGFFVLSVVPVLRDFRGN